MFEGHYIYHSFAYGTRDQESQIAHTRAMGFSHVMPYSMTSGNADLNWIEQCLNWCQKHGLKVIFPFSNVLNYTTSDVSATYVALCSGLGITDPTLLMQKLISIFKTHPALYGYYTGDEVTAGNAAAWATWSDAIKAADSTHPRLNIQAAVGGFSYNDGTTTNAPHTDIGGDDNYLIGSSTSGLPAISTMCSGIHNFCVAQGISEAMVFQATSWYLALPNAGGRNAYWPSSGRFPTYDEQVSWILSAFTKANPRLIGWYSYFDMYNYPYAKARFNDLAAAIDATRNNSDNINEQMVYTS